MKQRAFLIAYFFALFAFPATHVQAEDANAYTVKNTKSNKMHSRNLPIAGLPEKETKNKESSNNQSLNKSNTELTKEEKTEDTVKEETSPEEKIWEKYKKLAQGTESNKPEKVPETKTNEKSSQEKEREKAAAGSLQSILEDYKKRNEGGASMHSRSLKKDQALKNNK